MYNFNQNNLPHNIENRMVTGEGYLDGDNCSSELSSKDIFDLKQDAAEAYLDKLKDEAESYNTYLKNRLMLTEEIVERFDWYISNYIFDFDGDNDPELLTSASADIRRHGGPSLESLIVKVAEKLNLDLNSAIPPDFWDMDNGDLDRFKIQEIAFKEAFDEHYGFVSF